MKEKILRDIVSMVCNGFLETILVGIEEQEKEFPYVIACANFISELKAKNIEIEFNSIFTDNMSDKLFRETSNYLAR